MFVLLKDTFSITQVTKSRVVRSLNYEVGKNVEKKNCRDLL